MPEDYRKKPLIAGIPPMRGSFGPDKEQKFLEAFMKTGKLYTAALACGASYYTMNAYRKKNPHFDQAIKEMQAQVVEALEEVAYARALEGVQEPLVSMGEVVTFVTKYDNDMLRFLLRAHAPDKYRDNVKVDHNVQGGVLLIPAAPTNVRQALEDQQRKLQETPMMIEGKVDSDDS